MFTIEMLPASYGDCLWIEYGKPSDLHRILVDGGVISAFKPLRDRIRSLPKKDRVFELLVVTHVDGDHIEGAIKLLGALESLEVKFNDVWFNGYDHLHGRCVPSDKLGGPQGEYLSTLIGNHVGFWNMAFDGNPVEVPSAGPMPRKIFREMTVTLLTPSREALENLIPKWEDELEKAGLNREDEAAVLSALQEHRTLAPLDRLGDTDDVDELSVTPFKEDNSASNRSSISFLAEFDGKRALLTGDAFPSDLSNALKRLGADDNNRFQLDVIKIPHHGSAGNLSIELLNLLRCPTFLVSTNGKKHGHPDRKSIARIVGAGIDKPQICFNYRTEITEFWDLRDRGQGIRYKACYPTSEADGFYKISL